MTQNLFPVITNYEERVRLFEARKRRVELERRPGTLAAVTAGCLCPVLDNAHGFGYLAQEGNYVMRLDCPLHGERASGTPPVCQETSSNNSERST